MSFRKLYHYIFYFIYWISYLIYFFHFFIFINLLISLSFYDSCSYKLGTIILVTLSSSSCLEFFLQAHIVIIMSDLPFQSYLDHSFSYRSLSLVVGCQVPVDHALLSPIDLGFSLPTLFLQGLLVSLSSSVPYHLTFTP